ncbi:hypothetical protein Tco_0733682 [Tanacetum coccineum]
MQGPQHVVVQDSLREALSAGRFGTVGLTDGICKSTSEENKESVQCSDAFGQICRDRRISIEASPGGL